MALMGIILLLMLIVLVVIGLPAGWFVSEVMACSRWVRCALGVAALISSVSTAWIMSDDLGYGRGCQETRDRYLKQPFMTQEHWQRLLELERNALTNAYIRPSTMTSGKYVLESSFPGMPREELVMDLVFTNGQLITAEPRAISDLGEDFFTDGFKQKGNVISAHLWTHRADDAKLFDRQYIGLADGNMMWGRVYLLPGQGWQESRSPDVGVWRAYKNAE